MDEWIIGGSRERGERIEVPVEVPGWEERPYVVLRPMTYEERARREWVGVHEEHEPPEVDEWGVLMWPETAPVRVTRDPWAKVEYDLRCCLVDFCLPMRDEDGSVRQVRFDVSNWERNVEVFKRLPPALAEWVEAQLDRVNRRRPEDRRELRELKNS